MIIRITISSNSAVITAAPVMMSNALVEFFLFFKMIALRCFYGYLYRITAYGLFTISFAVEV